MTRGLISMLVAVLLASPASAQGIKLPNPFPIEISDLVHLLLNQGSFPDDESLLYGRGIYYSLACRSSFAVLQVLQDDNVQAAKEIIENMRRSGKDSGQEFMRARKQWAEFRRESADAQEALKLWERYFKGITSLLADRYPNHVNHTVSNYDLDAIVQNFLSINKKYKAMGNGSGYLGLCPPNEENKAPPLRN